MPVRYISVIYLNFITGTLHLVMPFIILPIPPSLFPGNHPFVLCIYESASGESGRGVGSQRISLFVFFSVLHISEITWYLSFSDSCHLAYDPLGSSMRVC